MDTRPGMLLPSPLTALRMKHRISAAQAAGRLDMSILRLARLEASTRRIPTRAWLQIAALLDPPSRFVQLSIRDEIASLETPPLG